MPPALPADSHPDRRALLTSGAAAALIASTAPAAATAAGSPLANPDAELLALRPQWLAIRAAMDAEDDPRSPADLPRYRAIMASMPMITDAISVADMERIREQRQRLRGQLPKAIEEPWDAMAVREDRLAALIWQEDELIDRLISKHARPQRRRPRLQGGSAAHQQRDAARPPVVRCDRRPDQQPGTRQRRGGIADAAALPPRSPLAALIAEQHAREQLIAAMVAGERIALRQFIRADWRCWRAARRLRRSPR